MTDIPDNFVKENPELTGTLKLGAAVKTIGYEAFHKTNLEGLDLSNADSLVSIEKRAFGDTDITGTLMIPAKVETIGTAAFWPRSRLSAKLTGLDLSNAASLESIGAYAFGNTDIKGRIETPFTVPAYNAAISFPPGVTIVKG